MSKVEYVQYVAPTGETRHGIKTRDSKTGEEIIYRSLFEIPVDTHLYEIIEDFGIPIIKIPGKPYKIKFLARKDIIKTLGMEKYDLTYPENTIDWIDSRETISREDYNKQISSRTEFYLKKGGSNLILYSISDAIQILSIKQNDREKGKLIRKLILKLRELQNKLNKHQKEEIKNLQHILGQLDDVCYDWIKEHQEDNIYEKGYKRLWGHQLWQMIIDVHRRIRDILGLLNPPKEHTGLHHFDRPYRRVYPHVATRCRIIDSRHDHNHPIQKKYIR